MTTTNSVAKSARFFDGKALGLLSGTLDRYKGITVTDTQGIEASQFKTTLENSLKHYQELGFRAIWLKVPKQQMQQATIATTDCNFDFHHAKPEYLMLNKWLDKGPSRLPGYATHYIGVGGLVMNKEKTKLLCIQEQRPLLPGVWKLPGGLVEQGESLDEASVREVWEETGVKCKFQSVIGFRELLNYQFDQQDIYFVCMLEPENEQIQIQMTHEIEKAQWIDIDQLAKYEFSRMATKICELISNANLVGKKQIDFGDMPLGDVFRDQSFTKVSYDFMTKNNNFYSSEYLTRVGNQIRKAQPKL